MKRVAILGSPVTGALSPVIHRAAYEELGLDWKYEAVECAESGLERFLEGVRADESWAGLSLTMPLKRAAPAYLDEISELVAMTGAANTVTVRGGRLLGENTDVVGMERAIKAVSDGRPGSVAILGAGATAATALCVARGFGIRDALIVTRDLDRVGAIRAAAERMDVRLQLAPWSEARTAFGRDLAISALPPFAADDLGSGELDGFTGLLLDVAYRPSPTRLVQHARDAGAVAVTGLSMLVHQAVRQLELQVGAAVKAPYDRMLRAAREALQ